jgi:hypothetical protein
MNRTTPLALALTSLLAIACSDWGFTPFRRDPCRRDPAACLPDDPRACDGAAAPASTITELVCPLRTSKWQAELYWEVEVDARQAMRIGGVLPPSSPGEPSVIWVPVVRPKDGSDSLHELHGYLGNDGALIPVVTVEHPPQFGRPQIDRHGVTWFPVSLTEWDDVSEIERSLGTWLVSVHGGRVRLPDGIEGAPQYRYTSPGDFDGDGELDMWGNEYMFDHNGALRFEARTQRRSGSLPWAEPIGAIADVTGDGRREYLFSDGFFRQDGHFACRSPHTHSSFAVVDVDGDSRPEVLALNNKLEPAPRTLSILDGQCRVLRSVNLEDALPSNAMLPNGFGPVLMAIAPMLRRDKPAFLVEMRRISDDPDRPRWSHAWALFDHDLTFVRLIDRVSTLASPLVDLDGDGIYELLDRPVDGNEIVGRGLWVLDLRSGERRQLIDAALVGQGDSAYAFADIDGDGRGEIVLIAEDDDGRRFLRTYKGAGPGFAAAWRFETFRWAGASQPYLFNPDGTPSQEPVRYDRLGLYNATPSGGWWAAVDADLRVRFTDLCTTDCPEGWLTYTVRVGNHGDVGADVLVRVYGERGDERTLLSEQRYRDVNSGQWNAAEPVSVRFQGAPFDRLRAVVEPDGWESQECDKTNNEAVWNLDCR